MEEGIKIRVVPLNMGDVLELKILIQRVLLPRIKQLEGEVASLRRHTWPYVQANKESHQLDDMNAKLDFLKHLDEPTIYELLRLKSKVSESASLSLREYDIIISANNKHG
jgi:hypothetical protein